MEEDASNRIMGYQYAIGALNPILQGDLEKCSLATFSRKKAKLFISNRPMLYFLDRPYISEVVGIYQIFLDVKNPEKFSAIQRVVFPDMVLDKGILGTEEMKEKSDNLFKYQFVRKTEGINPLLVSVFFNPDLPDSRAIENLVEENFGDEWRNMIDIRPYRKVTR